MKSIRSFFLSLIILMIPSLAMSETVLYCSTELEVGIKYKGGKWIETNYSPLRWTIKLNDDETIVRGTFPVENKTTFTCKRIKIALNAAYEKTIVCRNERGFDGSAFIYNPSTKKFLWNNMSAYGYTGLRTKDNVGLFAGKCEKF